MSQKCSSTGVTPLEPSLDRVLVTAMVSIRKLLLTVLLPAGPLRPLRRVYRRGVRRTQAQASRRISPNQEYSSVAGAWRGRRCSRPYRPADLPRSGSGSRPGHVLHSASDRRHHQACTFVCMSLLLPNCGTSNSYRIIVRK